MMRKFSSLLALCLMSSVSVLQAQDARPPSPQNSGVGLPQGAPQKNDNIVQRAQGLMQREQFAEAVQLLNGALQQNGEVEAQKPLKIALADVQFNWALALWFKEQKYETALEHAEAALVIDRALRPASAADELNKLGQGLNLLGQTEKAINYWQQAQQIYQRLKDRSSEAAMLLAMGTAYQAVNRYDKAETALQAALPLARATHDALGEAWILGALGSSHLAQSHFEQTIQFSEQALMAARATRGQPLQSAIAAVLATSYAGETRDSLNNVEGTMIGNLGIAYQSLGRPDKAAPYFEQAVALSRQNADKQGEAMALANLGATYVALGRHEKALPFLEQALQISRAQEFSVNQQGLLDALGYAYRGLNQLDKAHEISSQALDLARRNKDRRTEAAVLVSLGMDVLLKNPVQAVQYGQQALEIDHSIGDVWGESQSLKLLSMGHLLGGQIGVAADEAGQSLAISRQIKSRGAEADVLAILMLIARASNQSRLAIFYGKQAINNLQQTRASLTGFDRETQKGFLKSNANIYRWLADLLIEQGRLPEAQQVLGMLKQEEFFDFVQRDRNEATTATRASLTPDESAWEKRYDQISEKITALGVERGQLAAKTPRSPDEEAHLVSLDDDLAVAGQAFQKLLDTLAQEADNAPAANTTLRQLQDSEVMMQALHQMGDGTVALYTLVSEDKYRVILFTAETQKAAEYAIPAAELNAKIAAFRAVLQDPTRDPRPLGHELYEILIAPIAKDLAGAGAKTLMWSLDGALRYLPVSALYDGKAYLAERFRNVVFTPASQLNLEAEPTAHWTALGLGVSKAQSGFSALPGVVEELHGIIGKADDNKAEVKRSEAVAQDKGVLPGKVALDEAFTAAAMKNDLGQGFSVVHIASHFQFVPGNEADSFLLLGDGSHLSLSQIKAIPNFFRNVELLTLSACNTATGSVGGDGREVEGFGVVAQRKGAKAVMASLWPVADESTQLLMRHFYRIREAQPGTSKAEALRLAQMALLHGEAKTSETATQRGARFGGGDVGAASSQPEFKADPQAPFAHPYFWAPFILIGNWK